MPNFRSRRIQLMIGAAVGIVGGVIAWSLLELAERLAW